jgi:hypothetical protein
LLIVLDLKNLRNSLAGLTSQLPEYFERLRGNGFECCHINEDWIESRCSAADVVMHKRYLVEFAHEVLASGKLSPDYGDAQNCLSPWLNKLKADRLAQHGPYENLCKAPHSRYLVELSPGWREFMRVRESCAAADQAQVADQLATFVYRQAKEIKLQSGAITTCRNRLQGAREELALQALFATELARMFDSLGARTASTLRRNQVLQCDEQIVAVVFNVADDCVLALLPSVVSSAPAKSTAFEGTLGIGFRLMRPAALAASQFEFGRDTVLHLHELLPNKFNDYGRFNEVAEFCLNSLAWTAALRILLPDTLHALQVATTGKLENCTTNRTITSA